MISLKMDLKFFSLLILASACYGLLLKDQDPCTPDRHRRIEDPHRSPRFRASANETPLCDNKLSRGWYRFQSIAGNEMLTSCQELNTCGTVQPIWLNGTHPTVSEGIVIRKICGNLNTSTADPVCCEYSEEIFVKNCQGFYIYYLYPTTECPMAYCAGNIPPCPPGKWSHTGFPPCKDLYPRLTDLPILRGPYISSSNNKSVSFECEFVHSDNDPEQRFEITWSFSGQRDSRISRVILTANERLTVLYGNMLKGHEDTYVACELRSYYTGHQQDKSPTLKSNSTFFGLQEPPTLTGPNIFNNRSFHFKCTVNHIYNNSNQDFEIVWTFNGIEDPNITPSVISDPDRTSRLDGASLKGHLNTRVACKARLLYTGNNIRTSFLSSDSYFAGIQVTPNILEMSEKEYERQITISSSIPILCEDGLDCCLTFKLNMNETSAVSLLSSCESKLCSAIWNDTIHRASVQIAVVPVRDVVVRASQHLYMSFAEVDLPENNSYIDIFRRHQPSRIQINIKNVPGSSCTMTGDPHIKGFDGLYYDLFVSGDFIAYQGLNRDIQVHIRTSPCARVACICAVVIKERNDVIKISTCGRPSGRTAATVAIAYGLNAGVIIQRSADGKYFGIYLPSGTEIKVEFRWDSVYLSLPAFDNGQGRGVCGNNDGVKGNGFTYPDGFTDTFCTGSGRCKDKFVEAWRVSGNSSLFEYVPEPTNKTEVTSKTSQQFCSCTSSINGSTNIQCSPRGNIRSANTLCPGCPDITSTLRPSYIIDQGWINPLTGKPEGQYVHQEIPAIDPNKSWPNEQGITEDKARALCTKALQKSQLFAECQNKGNVEDTAMRDCLSDILYGGSVEYLDAITSALTTECQMSLATDPVNYVNGSAQLKPQYGDDLCPVECLAHGKCGNSGKCICQKGWEGAMCHIQSGIGPQLQSIFGGPLCDIVSHSCDKIFINVTNVDLSDTLKCRIQAVDEKGKPTGVANLTAAIAVSSDLIGCSLPQTVISTNYNVSATNDGVVFGNGLTVFVYDATCLSCTEKGCQTKSTACYINHICYKNGEINTENVKQICDVTKSTSKWSYVKELENGSGFVMRELSTVAGVLILSILLTYV